MTAVVIQGDARSLPLPDESVDLIVTSPPYLGQRLYEDGGKPLKNQIGIEDTAARFLQNLWTCTREWARVLKPTGSMFINLGDKFVTDNRGSGVDAKRGAAKWAPAGDAGFVGRDLAPHKSIMGTPWLYVLGCTGALAALGMPDPGLRLILRRDIIWEKPNPLPDSPRDRAATRHEYVFHLVKQPGYFTAVDELREPQETLGQRHNGRSGYAGAPADIARGFSTRALSPLGKLPGSVWRIPLQPLIIPEWLGVKHYATFPTELPRRCVIGWCPNGICLECGQGRFPVTAKTRRKPNDRLSLLTRARTSSARGSHVGSTLGYTAESANRHIIGYACPCCPFTDHPKTDDEPAWREYHLDRWLSAPTSPARVLDPFGGAGTTAMVADLLGGTGISVDLGHDYSRVARWRVNDPGERARALGLPKPAPVPDGQGALFGAEAAS
jgi:hypothetical protein